jgi:hypothetical protein
MKPPTPSGPAIASTPSLAPSCIARPAITRRPPPRPPGDLCSARSAQCSARLACLARHWATTARDPRETGCFAPRKPPVSRKRSLHSLRLGRFESPPPRALTPTTEPKSAQLAQPKGWRGWVKCDPAVAAWLPLAEVSRGHPSAAAQRREACCRTRREACHDERRRLLRGGVRCRSSPECRMCDVGHREVAQCAT